LAVPIVNNPKQRNWVDYIAFNSLSLYIFRNTGNYCDAPFFEDSGHLNENRSGTLAAIMGLYFEFGDLYLMDEFKRAVKLCDPNFKSNFFRSGHHLTPLQHAIFYANSQIVDILLRHGADPSIKMDFKGKPYDQLDALDFSRFLQGVLKSDDDVIELKKIENLIIAHQNLNNIPTEMPDSDAQPQIPDKEK
jgi:hypothetical protein